MALGRFHIYMSEPLFTCGAVECSVMSGIPSDTGIGAYFDCSDDPASLLAVNFSQQLSFSGSNSMVLECKNARKNGPAGTIVVAQALTLDGGGVTIDSQNVYGGKPYQYTAGIDSRMEAIAFYPNSLETGTIPNKMTFKQTFVTALESLDVIEIVANVEIFPTSSPLTCSGEGLGIQSAMANMKKLTITLNAPLHPSTVTIECTGVYPPNKEAGVTVVGSVFTTRKNGNMVDLTSNYPSQGDYTITEELSNRFYPSTYEAGTVPHLITFVHNLKTKVGANRNKLNIFTTPALFHDSNNIRCTYSGVDLIATHSTTQSDLGTGMGTVEVGTLVIVPWLDIEVGDVYISCGDDASGTYVKPNGAAGERVVGEYKFVASSTGTVLDAAYYLTPNYTFTERPAGPTAGAIDAVKFYPSSYDSGAAPSTITFKQTTSKEIPIGGIMEIALSAQLFDEGPLTCQLQGITVGASGSPGGVGGFLNGGTVVVEQRLVITTLHQTVEAGQTSLVCSGTTIRPNGATGVTVQGSVVTMVPNGNGATVLDAENVYSGPGYIFVESSSSEDGQSSSRRKNLRHEFTFYNTGPTMSDIPDTVGGAIATPSATAKLTGTGIALDGTESSFIQIMWSSATEATWASDDLTIEIVAKWSPTEPTSTTILFDCGGTPTSANFLADNWIIDTPSGIGQKLGWNVVKDGAGSQQGTTCCSDFGFGNRHHIVATISKDPNTDLSTMQLFLDGVSVAAYTSAGGAIRRVERNQCYIGRASSDSRNSAGSRWSGEISVLRMYSDAKDANWVSDAYRFQFPILEYAWFFFFTKACGPRLRLTPSLRLVPLPLR
jgi:hypothetical protein